MYTWMNDEVSEGRAQSFSMYYAGHKAGRIVEVEAGFYNVFAAGDEVEVQINEGLATLTEARTLLQHWARSHC